MQRLLLVGWRGNVKRATSCCRSWVEEHERVASARSASSVGGLAFEDLSFAHFFASSK